MEDELATSKTIVIFIEAKFIDKLFISPVDGIKWSPATMDTLTFYLNIDVRTVMLC